MTEAPAARFPWRRYVGFALLILVLALLPVISVAIAATLANLNGCALDEGSVHPCLIAGADWGETLYTLAVLGWLGLATIPFGIAGLGMLLVALLVHRFTWRRARRREIEP